MKGPENAYYALPQKICNFSESIFPGDSEPRSVTEGDEHSQEWITGRVNQIKLNHMITDL